MVLGSDTMITTFGLTPPFCARTITVQLGACFPAACRKDMLVLSLVVRCGCMTPYRCVALVEIVAKPNSTYAQGVVVPPEEEP